MKALNLKRRRAQRGRPREEGVERTASGRKSRAKEPGEDPRRVALAARQRVLGVSPDNAGQPRAATVLGRLELGGVITDSMYRAGERYLELYQAMRRAVDAPVGLAVTSGRGSPPKDWAAMGPVEVGDEEFTIEQADYTTTAIKAVATFEAMKAALSPQECGFPARAGIVESVVIYDRLLPECWNGVLQHGLAVLAKKMGIDRAGPA